MKKLFFVSLPMLSFLLMSSSERKTKTQEQDMMVVVSERAEILAAGTRYEAEVFLYTVPANKPVMSYDGGTLKVDNNGVGKISFIAAGGAYDKYGQANKKFHGRVKLFLNGKDTILDFVKEYTVQKPSIETSGIQAKVLYKNCGNELNVQVPILCSTYNPSFRADGAMVIAGARKGFVTVVPAATKVTLHVANLGNALGAEEFQVRDVPMPEILIYNDTSVVNLKDGIKISQLSKVKMHCRPEAYFAMNYPKDAKFRVAEWVVSLMRADQVIENKVISLDAADLSEYVTRAQKEDRLVFELNKIQRVNFLNRIEVLDLNSNNKIFTVPLN